MKLKPFDMVSVALFAALMGIGANITAYLVIGGVPITLQPIIAILAGALLGSRLGALAMIVYMLIGLIGMPVFAEFSGGLRALVSPTFGFILSFILTAFITGKIIERKTNPTLPVFFFATFTGLFINYVVGTNYMYYAYLWIAEAPEGFTYSMVWMWMVLPLIKDIIFTALTAVAVPKIYRILSKQRSRLNPSQRTA